MSYDQGSVQGAEGAGGHRERQSAELMGEEQNVDVHCGVADFAVFVIILCLRVLFIFLSYLLLLRVVTHRSNDYGK